MRRSWLFISLVILAILLRAIQPAVPWTFYVVDSPNVAEGTIHLFASLAYSSPGLAFTIKCILVILGCITSFILGKMLAGDFGAFFALFLYSICGAAIFFEGFGQWTGEGITPILFFFCLALLCSKRPLLLSKILFLNR